MTTVFFPAARRNYTGLAIVVFAALAAFGLNLATRPVLAALPVAAYLTFRAVQRFPVQAAGALPAISIVGDGLLVHFKMQTPLRLSTVVVALLVLSILVSPKTFHPPVMLLGAWLIALFLANYVLIAMPTGKQAPYQIVAILLEGIIVAVVVGTLAPDPIQVLFGAGVSGLVVSYFTFFPEYKVGFRPYALGLDPNYMGTILAVSVTAWLTVAKIRGSWKPLVLVVPPILGLVQIQSRSAALAAFVGTIAVITLTVTRRRGFLIMIAGLAFTVAATATGFKLGFGPFTDRRRDTGASSEERRKIARVNIAAIKKDPVYGLGMGVVSNLGTGRDARLGGDAVAHNDYLRLASESGVPSLLGMLLLLAGPLATGILSRNRRGTAALLWPCLASVLVTMAFLNSLDNSQLATMVMTLAGAGWAANQSKYTTIWRRRAARKRARAGR